MLEDIQDKISRLIALYEGERQRAESLSLELSKSRETVQDQQRQIAELKNKIDSVQLQSAFTAGGTPEAKARITALVREIDKCITLLEED